MSYFDVNMNKFVQDDCKINLIHLKKTFCYFLYSVNSSSYNGKVIRVTSFHEVSYI